MAWGFGRVAFGALTWLILALIWPALAQPQTVVAAQAPAAITIPTLPDAPSASLSRQTILLARNGSMEAQSWWLVSPENAPFRPLTPREKFQSFVHHTFSPYMFAGAAYDASWAQAWGDPREYGGGMQGWGKRFGAAIAGTESRSFFGAFLFPTLLHQDPRYFAMYKGPVVKRGIHAISRVFVARDDNGDNVFNSSGMLAIAFTESLGMAWTPEGKRSAHTAFTRMLGAMQGDAANYVLREFTPDFLRMFKRHAPKSLKRIEERLPQQMTGDTGQP